MMPGYTPRWRVRCVRCRTTRDASQVGIVRLGAWSWLNRTVGWCSTCRGLRVLAIERQPDPIPSAAP